MTDRLTALFDQNALRWSLIYPVIFAFGAGFYLVAHEEPPIIAIVAFAAIALICRSFLRSYLVRSLCLMCFAFLCGVLVAQCKARLVAAPMLIVESDIIRIEGVLASIEYGDNGNRLRIRTSAISDLPSAQTPRFVRVTQRKDTSLSPGRWVTCLAKLSPPPSSGVPGDYDFQQQAYFQQLGAVGFVLGKCEPMPVAGGRRSVLEKATDWIGALRRKAAISIQDGVRSDAGGLAAAITTGDRSFLEPEHVEALRGAGLAHLLAISGLHMGLAGGVFFFGARWIILLIEPLALRIPPNRFAALFALAACTSYLLLSGASVATQRAFIMAGTAFVAKLLDRSALTMRSLAIAMVVVTILQPESVVTPGFQMSFAATGALVAVYERAKRRARSGQPLVQILMGLSGAATASFTASIATAPVALFHFQRVASLSIPANILASPVITFWVAPSAALSAITAPFGVQDVFLLVFGKGLEVILQIASWFARGEGGAIKPIAGADYIWILIAMVWLVVLRGALRYLACVPLIMSLWSWQAGPVPTILIDRQAQVFAKGEDGWRFLATCDKAAKPLAPLQVDQFETLRCMANGCSMTLSDGASASITAQSSCETGKTNITITSPAGEQFYVADPDRLRGTRISVRPKGDQLRIERGPPNGERPWSQGPP